MLSRIAQHNRLYRRRMSVTFPLSATCVLLAIRLTPVDAVPPEQIHSLALRGPFEVMPELDIDPDVFSEERLTAAPVSVMSSDFVAVELRTLVDPQQNEPVTDPQQIGMANEPRPTVPGRDRLEALTLDDIGDAVRTTGLPMPAASDLEVLHVERPVYPPRAIQLEIEGMVEIAMLVDERGQVVFARAIDADRLPLLETAAVEAAYRYLFKPYVVRGAPTPFWVRIPFEFRLLS